MTNKPDVYDMGETVYCDCCGKDYTNSSETGGFLFGSKAYCPVCAQERLPKIKAYHEEHYIKQYCPEGMPFAKWVIKLRNGDNTIKVYSF